MTPPQLTDGRGLAVSTSSDVSATAYADGVELLLAGLMPEAITLLRAAVESDPHFELAHVALTCALMSAGMPPEAPRCGCSPLSCRASTRRERQHIEIVRLALSGERARAAVLGREHLHEFPNDSLVAHTLTSHGLA